MGRRQVTDLRLVNLAATHGIQLATFDAKISRALDLKDQVHGSVWS